MMVDCTCWEPPQQTVNPMVTTFLLVQKGQVIDLCSEPHKLAFELLDEFIDWQIYAGGRNEFGKKEIMGYVAKVWVANCYSKITVQVKDKNSDSHSTFTATDEPSRTVQSALAQLSKRHAFADPVNLPIIKLFAA